MNQPQLGIRISELRKKKAMTQKELADACNVDIRTIQRIESGEVVPRMYTIRLLSNALDADINDFNGEAVQQNIELHKQIRWSFIAGIVFSINCIPVILNIITKSFDPFMHGTIIMIHIITFVLFSRGFYLLGKQFNNEIITISSFLSMILLPLLNMMDLLNPYFGFGLIPTVFTAVCINAIIFGASLLIEAKRRTDLKIYYKVAGITTIIQSGLFLSLNLTIIIVGLIISIFCNIILVMILYTESRNLNKQPEKTGLVPSFA